MTTNGNENMVECSRGHTFTAENTYYWCNKRLCRTCRRDWQRAYRIKTANPHVRVVGEDFVYALR